MPRRPIRVSFTARWGHDIRPYLASCRFCGALGLILPWELDPTWVQLWDPDFVERRMVRSLLSAAEVARQGWGYHFGALHYCPGRQRWEGR